MKYCYNCYNNFEDNENYKYCPFCGKPLYDEELVSADLYGVWEVFTEGKSLGCYEGSLDDVAFYLNDKKGHTFNFSKLNSKQVKTEDVVKDTSVISIKKIQGLNDSYWAIRKAFEDKGLSFSKNSSDIYKLKVSI